MAIKITILGCGTSSGVPRPFVGFGAGVDGANPKNTRMRASVLVEAGDEVILIDTSPDLRAQILQYITRPITAVLYTHTHADHCHGIDELRWVCAHNRAELPIYADKDSLQLLQNRFGYCFKPKTDDNYYRPMLQANEINGAFMVGNVAVQPIIQDHGYSTSLGFRIGNFAYSTDVWQLDTAAKTHLHGLDLWVVDALQHDPHPTHAHLARTIGWIDELQPQRAVLTHLNFNVDYADYLAHCPANTQPAVDGMVVYSS